MFNKKLSMNSLSNLSHLGGVVMEKGEKAKIFQTLPVVRIYSKAQPRTVFEHIEELAENMKAIGQQQPIVVSVDEDGRYVIEQGERRWRAAKLAKIPTLDCIVIKSNSTEDERLIRQLSENIQRDDMTLWDLSNSIALLVSKGMTIRTIAEKLGKKEPFISVLNSINKLPTELEELVKEQNILDPKAVRRLQKTYQDDPQAVKDQIRQWREIHEANDPESKFVITRAQVLAFIKGRQPDAPSPRTPEDSSETHNEEESQSPVTAQKEEGTKVQNASHNPTLPNGCSALPVGKSRLAVLWNENEAYVTPDVLAPEGKLCITIKASNEIYLVDASSVTVVGVQKYSPKV